MKRGLVVVALVALGGCTVVNTAVIPGAPFEKQKLFVTTGDIDLPYESLGPLQVTRRGVIVFGFWDPAGFNIEDTFADAFIPEARKIGADGVINVEFEQTQYTLGTKILGAIFFFAPLPAEVTIRGEAVRLLRSPGPRRVEGEGSPSAPVLARKGGV